MKNDMEKKKLSHIVQDKIKEVEHKIIPGVNWDKQKSWDKIKDILNAKNKQLIMWYFATAASISILVAATVDTTIPYLHKVFEQEHNETVVNAIIPQLLNNDSEEVETKSLIESYDLDFKKMPDEHKLIKESLCTKNQIKAIEGSKQELSIVENKEQNKPSLNFGTSIGGNKLTGLAPGLSFDVRQYLNGNGSKIRYISIGASTSFIFKAATENNHSEFYPATFVNAKYGQRKLQGSRNTEWEIGAGYLINPNQVIYKDTTIRFQYTRTISGRLKVGPELILTDNMRKLYPGFTLAFG